MTVYYNDDQIIDINAEYHDLALKHRLNQATFDFDGEAS